ncbi:hypothetical protein IQ260_05530 [Leptolyngbya cf. ectocarpi LEGE 11479]|uniref:PEP-CTERM sorting domain-containing protein n=1 Tax=Leptolyngbya cf. ectocarpi LEGE 11479 TaxID=1828722 RepID=A0A928X0A5_LEPEC|nr:hypothetical protein [Leptolyngbya ectocarpi]MBE9066107.1 hypothetical protein [Leptolyngbya cf. ectocarpi LEGE 11479]
MRTFLPSTPQVGLASLFSAGLLAVGSTVTQAACLSGCSQNGLVFSEASSSFKITDVAGVGTRENPFVVYQDVLGLDISLAVSGLTNASQHSLFNRPGFAISIVSRNLTGAFWRFYDHELQETAGVSSSENDGLSFAQGLGAVRPYTSDRYTQADEVTDVRDFINFYRGAGVNPGESVRFDYFITDTIPNQQFYIRQRPDYRPNTTPTSVILQNSLKPIPEVQPTPVSPIETALQPTTVQPVAQPTNSPVPLTKTANNPQSVPEPSSSVVGLLSALLSMVLTTQRQRLRSPKP